MILQEITKIIPMKCSNHTCKSLIPMALLRWPANLHKKEIRYSLGLEVTLLRLQALEELVSLWHVLQPTVLGPALHFPPHQQPLLLPLATSL